MTDPVERPTVSFEKPPEWAVSMREQMVQGFTRISQDLGLVSNDVSLIKERVSIVEGRTATLEARADTNSTRAKGQSEIDATQEAQIAQERDARGALAVKVEGLAAKVDSLTVLNVKQLDILESVFTTAKRIADHPLVKYAAAMIWTALVAYLAKRGISIQ